MVKRCSKCGQDKSVDEFNRDKSRKDGRFPQCRTCRATYTETYRATNKEEINTKQKANLAKRMENAEVRAKYLEKHSVKSLKRRYGITSHDVIKLGEQQRGVCAICKKAPKRGKYGGLRVDHDHVTKRVRGLLCNSCNTGIGHLKDDVNVLAAAIKYLTNPPAIL